MVVKLVDICLETIVDNFARFNDVFMKTQNVDRKRELEFLQRKYSFELITRLCNRDELPEEFVDFLINKYLKFLDTSWFRKCRWEKVTAKFAEIGSNIEKICIKKICIPSTLPENSPWQDLMHYLPNLRCCIYQENYYDSFLKNVAKFCCDIEEIHIDDGHFSALNDAKYLCSDEDGKPLCRKLKRLNAPIQIKDLKYLIKNLPSLEILSFEDLSSLLYLMHKNDLSSLDKVKPYNFTTISTIPDDFDENYLKVCMAVCPKLKNLVCHLRNKNQVDYLSSYLPELEELSIFSRSFFNVNVDVNVNVNNVLISKGRKLTRLELIYCYVSDSVLANSCPYLEELILVEGYILSENDGALEFNCLSSLSITNNLCEEEDINIGVNRLLLSLSEQLKSLTIHVDFSSPELKTCLLRCCERNPIEKIITYYPLTEKKFFKDLLSNCHYLKHLEIEIVDYGVKSEIDELLNFCKNMPSKPEVEVINND